jgi:hypothetical protein
MDVEAFLFCATTIISLDFRKRIQVLGVIRVKGVEGVFGSGSYIS